MPVQFVIGRAGSGKTGLFLDRTISACRADPLGPPIFWLVPRQMTFQVERDLCCGPNRSGFFRVHVVHFDLFSRHILERTGGAAGKELSPAGRRMILGHLIRRHQDHLKFFRSADAHGGLADELDATLNELTAAGADLQDLHSRLADSALSAKIADLLRIETAYHAFLTQAAEPDGLLDPDARLSKALEALEQCPTLSEANIYVDGFLHFTARERRMLVALSRICQQVQISLCFDPDSLVINNPHHLPDELSLFHGMEMEYRKLFFAFGEGGVRMPPPNLQHEMPRFQSPALRQIARWPAEEESSSDGLELIEVPGKRAEADAVAVRVRDLVAEGFRFRDVVVLSRNLTDYSDLLSAAFREHGIPFFLDDRRPAGHHPLIQFLRAGLEVASNHWPADAMTMILKSGLCGLTPAEADELENFCLLQNIRPADWADPKPWPDDRADLLRRKIVDPLGPLLSDLAGSPKTVRQICTALFHWLERCQVRQTLSQWIHQARAGGSLEQSAEHEQVWSELLELFDTCVNLLGQQPMTLSDFSALLDAALQCLDLAIAPATVDQVLIGQVDRTRPPAVKAAIIVGLSDGQFPFPPEPDKVLGDADRHVLSEHLVDVEPDRRRRALDETFLGYFAFTRASQRLIVTRPLSDGSRELGPSSLWRRLLQTAPSTPVRTISRPEESAASDISTPRQLVTGLMQWARRRDQSQQDDSLWPTLYDWFTRRGAPGDALDSLRQLAWPALSYSNSAELPPDLARQLFPSPLKADARQLETFRACPFQHFVRYGLNLCGRPAPGVSSRDISRLSHDVLDRLSRRLISAKKHWEDVTPAELNRTALESGVRLKGQWMLDSARNRFVMQQLSRALQRVVASQTALDRRGGFSLSAAGIRYDQEADLPPLRISTPHGNELLIRGRIDRVDQSAYGKAAVIYDYRLKTESLSLDEVYYGLALKLLTDLLAWQAACPSRPVAALMAEILRKTESGDPNQSPSPGEEKFDLASKPRGIINAQFAANLDHSLAPGVQSTAFSIHQKKDGEFGKGDTIDPADFDALTEFVRAELGRIGDEILRGAISVRPFLLGKQSPCTHCAFMDVCRFDPDDGYRRLAPVKRDEVLDSIRGAK